MNVEFATSRPDNATTVVLPVAKGSLPERIASESNADGLRAAASLARFEGDAGSIAEHVETRGGIARRVLLLGTGSASESDAGKGGGGAYGKTADFGRVSAGHRCPGDRYAGPDASSRRRGPSRLAL